MNYSKELQQRASHMISEACPGNEYIDLVDIDNACLDGHFSAKELRAIADVMDRVAEMAKDQSIRA